MRLLEQLAKYAVPNRESKGARAEQLPTLWHRPVQRPRRIYVSAKTNLRPDLQEVMKPRPFRACDILLRARLLGNPLSPKCSSHRPAGASRMLIRGSGFATIFP